MANTYAANFGDVVKHTLLGAVVAHERPQRYLESHGGRLDYRLDELDPGPGGVWDFLDAAPGEPALDGCAYTRLVRASAGARDAPGTYPGSIAVADALLPAGATVVAFEFVADSAASLAGGLRSRGRDAQVIVGDGLAGVVGSAAAGDLVLLDPFDMYARGGRFDSPGAFEELARRGVKTLLWYALYVPGEHAVWSEGVAARLARRPWHARFMGDEAVGGLAGCGWLAANLAPQTEEALAELGYALTRALAPTRTGLAVTFA